MYYSQDPRIDGIVPRALCDSLGLGSDKVAQAGRGAYGKNTRVLK
jgi:hypothetical protein